MKVLFFLLGFVLPSSLVAQLNQAEREALLVLARIPETKLELSLKYTENDVLGKFANPDPVPKPSKEVAARLKKSPKDPALLEEMGVSLRYEGKPGYYTYLDAALAIYQANYDKKPSVEALIKLGDHYSLARQRPDSALFILEQQVFKTDRLPEAKNSAKFMNHISQLGIQKQDFELAYNAAQMAFQLDETDLSVLVQRNIMEYMRLVYALGNHFAEPDADPNVNLYSLVDTTYLTIAWQKQPNKYALQVISHLNSVFYGLVGMMLQGVQVSEINPDSSPTDELGKLRLLPDQLARLDAAVSFLERGLAQKKLHPAFVHRALLVAAFLQGKTENANKHYTEAIKHLPDYGQNYLNQMLIQVSQEDYAGAHATILQFPHWKTSVGALERLAGITFYEKRYAATVDYIDQLYALQTEDPRAQLYATWAALYRGDTQTARALLDKVRPITALRDDKDYQLYDVCTEILEGKLTDARFKAKIAMGKHDEFPTMERILKEYIDK